MSVDSEKGIPEDARNWHPPQEDSGRTARDQTVRQAVEEPEDWAERERFYQQAKDTFSQFIDNRLEQMRAMQNPDVSQRAEAGASSIRQLEDLIQHTSEAIRGLHAKSGAFASEDHTVEQQLQNIIRDAHRAVGGMKDGLRTWSPETLQRLDAEDKAAAVKADEPDPKEEARRMELRQQGTTLLEEGKRILNGNSDMSSRREFAHRVFEHQRMMWREVKPILLEDRFVIDDLNRLHRTLLKQ